MAGTPSVLMTVTVLPVCQNTMRYLRRDTVRHTWGRVALFELRTTLHPLHRWPAQSPATSPYWQGRVGNLIQNEGQSPASSSRQEGNRQGCLMTISPFLLLSPAILRTSQNSASNGTPKER